MTQNRIHKHKINYNTQYFHKKYLRKLGNTNLGVVKSQKLYNDVAKMFFKLVLEDVYKNNLIYSLPFGFGKIYLTKIKPRIFRDADGKLKTSSPTNIKATKELWAKDPEAKEKRILVKYDNYHTDGHYYKVFWSKKRTLFKHSRYYKLDLFREHDRYLAKLINNGEADSPFVSDDKSILAL